ncbi:hypothetical protein BN1723_008458 [Verticillium longisporum]|uniref:RNA-binding domain-containing protein n=1 Tax=Verticillium longisporum TaxID=100787 RepID=A0A0G4KFM9_VERLO|nr:hypothetical protein BN1723_008458 [Verticillium longisporum]
MTSAPKGIHSALALSSRRFVSPRFNCFRLDQLCFTLVFLKEKNNHRRLYAPALGPSREPLHLDPVQFASAEDRDAALNSLPEDLKTRAQEDRSRPLVKIFIHRESKFAPRGGAGSWGSSRGGAGSANTGSGYRSAGGASDSESNRRGGRGGRGGGRGSERGRGRGRGGFKGDGGSSSPAPASATPAE